jgi:hypothetical protein
MRELALDGIGVPAAHFVEACRRHASETVSAHFFRTITKTA